MNAADIAAVFAILMAPALAVGALVVRYGAPLMRLDLERLYLHIVAALASFLTVFTMSGLVIFVSMLVTQTGSIDEPFLRGQIAMDVALVSAAAPAWLWHYARARQLSRSRRAGTMHRAYLYLVALFGVVGAVTCGGALVAQGVRLVMGLVDLASARALREVQASAMQWTINGAMFAALWWAHLRAARTWAG